LVSNGDFECTQLQREAKYKKFTYPNYFNRWMNVRKIWPRKEELEYLNAYMTGWNKIG